MTDLVKFHVSGKSMSTIDGSEIYANPVKYDGGSQGAKDAYQALQGSRRRRAGKGWTYVTEATREGAECILDYCTTVGETFAFETEPETRADGVALLNTAALIRKALAR